MKKLRVLALMHDYLVPPGRSSYATPPPSVERGRG